MDGITKIISRPRSGRFAKAVLASVAVVLLGACGGGDGATTMPLQAEKEQAALARAKALNADTMSRISAERAAGQRPDTR